MPTNTSMNKTGGERKAFRNTDNCVQAEMKNKVETVRLHLFKKILDRQQAHNKFMVEKDKRKSLRALASMRKTSGLSVHGEAPEGPADRSHENSPYFKCYRPLSEKRLLRWRAKEKMLQRFLEQEEEVIPPWEQDPNENLGQRFGESMRMLGYRVENEDLTDKMKKAQNDRENSPSKRLLQHKDTTKQLDVFRCLREDMGEDLSKTNNGKSFPISAWGEKVVRDYAKRISEPHPALKQRRVQSAAPRMQTETKQSQNGVTDSQDKTDSMPVSKVPVRPHTALTHSRGLKDVRVDRRPQSASNVPYRSKITSSSGEDSQGSLPCSQVDLTQADDVFTDSDSDDNLDKSESPEKVLSKSKNGVPSESQINGAGGSTKIRSTRPVRSISSTGVNLESKKAQAPMNRTKSADGLTAKPSSANGSTARTSDSNKGKLTKKDSQFLFSEVLRGTPRQNKVTFSLDEGENDPSASIENGETTTTAKKGPKVKSVQQLLKLKRSSKLSEADMEHIEDNMEELSGLGSKQEDLDGLFAKMPKNRDQREKRNVMLDKAEKRISLHRASRQHIEKSIAKADALNDIMEDSEDSDSEDEFDEINIRRMPQWKRDLMAEAPPGLFGPKSASKVVIAMSKSQRRRELDQLVKDNISDVKKLTDKEHARRIRARLHMYFTMRKLNYAVDKISDTKDGR